MKIPELLAPVGNMNHLKLAVYNGASSIYLSGKEFGARKFAQNFTLEEIREAVNFAHLYNVKVYVTVNILIKESELETVIDYIIELYKIGVDAILVQDIGLIKIIREILPNFKIHASTQMNIHNKKDIDWAKSQGIKRIVLSRELSLSEVKEITKYAHQNNMECEIFAHGALCYSYSGCCLISSYIGGRSGNRGRCAQPCRQEYSLNFENGPLLDENFLKESESKYLLSPKDLSLYEELNKILFCDSLKIEGRMRSEEYVSIVVGKYRQALNKIRHNKNIPTSEELSLVFNRKFTRGHLLDRPEKIMNYKKPSNNGLFIGKVVEFNGKNSIKVKLESKTVPEKGDGILIEGKVNPAIKDIKILAYNKNDNSLITTAMTNEEGKYKIGPLSMDDEYELKAVKEGYKIYQKNKNEFKCEKLSYLKVKVEDSEGNPLSGVFISLSSSERSFRANNNTNNDGYFTFIDLTSGEYYIQPFLKEYKFEQGQKSIMVKEGDHIDILLKAKRVAFSVFGKVNNLMREKLENLFIQAQNVQSNIIQETPIMKNGDYRLKGLEPGQKYIIKVKIPKDSNIERALPMSVELDIKKNDTFGVDFIVFNKYKEIDIRGYLNYTDNKDLGFCPVTSNSQYYVELYDNKDTDKILKTSNVNGACSFTFRKLVPGKYKLKIYEKINTSEKSNRLIKDEIVDINEDSEDIHNGVKIEEIKISQIQRDKESLRYTIYSPLFLLLLLCAAFKWDSTLDVINYIFFSPLKLFSSDSPKKEIRNKQKRK